MCLTATRPNPTARLTWQEAAAQPPSAPGSYQAAGWADTVQLDPSTPDAAAGGPAGASKRRRLGGQSKPAGGAAAAQAHGWLPQAEHIVRRFDEQLSKALDAALDACGGAAQQPASGADAGGGGGAAAAAAAGKRPAGLADTAASRAAVLEPFVQDRCGAYGRAAYACIRPASGLTRVHPHCMPLAAWPAPTAPRSTPSPHPTARCAEAAEGVAASLDARLLALPKGPQQQEGTAAAAAAPGGEDAAAARAPTATQALILGRVALGLASRSRMLPVVLGPPDQWRSAVRGGDAAAAGRPALPGAARLPAPAAPTPAPSARFERLQQRLHAVGLQAYGVWADWAAAGLASSLVAGLAADPSLAADAPLRSWEETVISSSAGGEGAAEGGGAAGALDMRFWLPAAATPPAVQAALAACSEADRAGGHLLEGEALALLKWRLGAALLSALRAGLGDADGDASGDASGAGVGGGSGGQLGGRLSEKGVLQLLFDVRFLTDLLAGGRPVGGSE